MLEELAIKFISWNLKRKGINNLEIVIRSDGHTVYKRNKEKEEYVKKILSKIKWNYWGEMWVFMKIFFNRFLRSIKYLIFRFKCEDCFNYNIGDGIDDINACGNCKNLKKYHNNN